MSRLLYLLALPVLPGVIALAAADAGLATASGAPAFRKGIECEIRVAKVPGGVELEAVAWADQNISGEYEFSIEKSGSGGSSSIVQGGEFSLPRKEERILGSAGLGSDRRASYSAQLTVEAADGEPLCRAEATR